ncbi:MAG TPA: dihydrodipicolinate synthase family protein [Casimicrobiaceae bacterium]|nr:dihydrodipicolinate synthase family protein [Casimicrobiaceae bacterium]
MSSSEQRPPSGPSPPKLRGVWSATLTPLAADGRLDQARLIAHVRRIFATGVDGVALFGTTGEGQSFSAAERRAGLEALLADGIDPKQVLAGTGCAALPETIELTRHAVACGCAGALVLPPFFFKEVSDEGVYASFARIADAVGDARLRMYLYHIPQVSGIAIGEQAIRRLVRDYPALIAGVKDSQGNLGHSLQLLSDFPQLAIFVGFEPHLPPALAAGGAGTICGIANLYPRLIRRLFDSAAAPEGREALRTVERFVAALQGYPLFAAFKALLAELSGDAAWNALRPPLVPLEPSQRVAWLAAVAACGLSPADTG